MTSPQQSFKMFNGVINVLFILELLSIIRRMVMVFISLFLQTCYVPILKTAWRLVVLVREITTELQIVRGTIVTPAKTMTI